MTAQLPLACMADGHRGKERGKRLIVIKNMGYALCDKCFDWFDKVGQIHIREMKEAS